MRLAFWLQWIPTRMGARLYALQQIKQTGVGVVNL
jgi:hypothetical protein